MCVCVYVCVIEEKECLGAWKKERSGGEDVDESECGVWVVASLHADCAMCMMVEKHNFTHYISNRSPWPMHWLLVLCACFVFCV